MIKPFFSFQWHITDDCDQRCKHCYIFSEDNSKKLDSMSWEQIEETYANIKDFCLEFDRRPYLYITGGDPILHKDFWRLLEMLHEDNVPFTILGNPYHLNQENCERMKELGCRKYQLSLDGDQMTHDWFRMPGSYYITLKKIKTLNEAGITSVIMSTVSGINVDQILGIIDDVAQAGVGIYAFARYCPTSEEKDIGLTPFRYRQLLADCDTKFRKLKEEGCRTYFSKKDHLWTLYEYETGQFKIPENAKQGMIYGGCNCGNGHLSILPNGDVFACRRVMNSKIGNVFSDRLADLWEAEMETYREFESFKKCKYCELLPYCRGCPAVASAHNGDFYAEDPQCWKEIKEYEYQKHLGTN